MAKNQHVFLPQTHLTQRGKAVRCGLALMLMLVIVPILNRHVFGTLDAVAPYARDISVLAGSASALGIALAARKRPSWMKANPLCILASAFFIVGCIGTNLGLLFDCPPAVYVFASLSSIVRSFVYVLIGVALSRLETILSQKAIVHAFLTSCLLSSAVYFLPLMGGVVLSYLLVAASSLLVFPLAKTVFEHQAISDAPEELAVTHPNTFLPFSAKLYICIFIFALAMGYSLRWGAHDGTPQSSLIALLIIGLLYAVSKAKTMPFPADILVRISALMIIAGFLSVLLVEQGIGQLSNAVISAGYSVFEMVSWIVLVSIACKNPLDAIPVIGWGRGIVSLGVTVGAQLGNVAYQLSFTNSVAPVVSTCAFVLLFCSFDFFVLHSFSLDEAIRDLAPLEETRISQEIFDSQTDDHVWLIDHRCTLIGQKCSLTPRETEIFIMLAKGRNSAFIQDKLVLSQNTVKTHVKHIYQKLDIHSHQELINYVENYQEN